MVTPQPPGESTQYTLLPTTRYVNWVAVAIGGVLAVLAPSVLWRVLCGAVALALLLLTWVVGRRRPVLILDDSGYRVEVGGRERFRVRWDEVQRVLRDRSEAALYLDCGDGKRNLLVPPAAGFAFTFSDRLGLVERILGRVGDKVQDVERLDKLPAPPTA
jgi:hypothetical protein